MQVERFSRFLVVGAIGFVADASLYWVLRDWFGQNVWLPRAISALTAMSLTYILNSFVTFRVPRIEIKVAALYVTGSLISTFLNVSTFAIVVHLLNGLSEGLTTSIGFVFGVMVGLVSNYLLYERLVFRNARQVGRER